MSSSTATRAESAEGVVLCRTSVTDISARKHAEEELIKLHDELEQRVDVRTLELRASEMEFRRLSREFQTLLKAISDTLILVSPEMEIIWINSDESLKKRRTEFDVAKQYYYSLLQEHFIFTQDNPITRSFQSAENGNCGG